MPTPDRCSPPVFADVRPPQSGGPRNSWPTSWLKPSFPPAAEPRTTEYLTLTTSTMNSHRLIVPTLTLCVLAACTGCVHTIKISYDPGPPAAPTLPCTVALSLSKEFTGCQYTTAASAFTDGIQAPFGPTMQKYATIVARSVFGDVRVIEGQSAPSEAKLLLIPRVTDLNLRA